jgi:protein-disulfide isomerase
MKSFAVALAVLLPFLAAGAAIDKGKTLGSPTAPVTIEILSDFECPACKTFHEETLPLLIREYVTPGKIYIVSREYPLNIPDHKYSREAANYATAAARVGKYYPVSNALFAAQSSWSASGKVWETVAKALTAAEQKKVQALVKEPSVTAEVQADVAYARSSDINQTPTLIVSRGSRRVPISGYALNYNLLRTLIDDLAK